MTDVATPAAPERKELEAWVSGVRTEIQRVTAAIEPLVAEQNRLRAREALLLKLLQSFDDATVPAPAGVPLPALSSSAPPPNLDGSVGEYVRTGVLEVLGENGGQPMHINDIHARFLAKGFRVPGAGRPANLTAHLGRCAGITSPTRGFYAIDNSEEVKKPRKRRRRRR